MNKYSHALPSRAVQRIPPLAEILQLVTPEDLDAIAAGHVRQVDSVPSFSTHDGGAKDRLVYLTNGQLIRAYPKFNGREARRLRAQELKRKGRRR